MPARALIPAAQPAAAPPVPALATFRVAYRPRPLSPDRRIVDLPFGPTLREVVERLVPDPAYREYAVVTARGVPVPKEWWPRLRPKPGQIVGLTIMPRGAGFARLALTLAVIAAAVAVTYFSAGTLGPFAASLLGAGVSMGGMLAINALIPPPAPDLGQKQKSPTYQLTGSTNAARPWQPVPRIFGKHKVVPPKAADDVADIQGNDQWLVSLFCWGYGPLRIDATKIGDEPTGSFNDIDIQTVDGSSLVAPSFDHYPTITATAAFQKALRHDIGWVTSTTALATDSAVVEITFPSGLIRYSKSSGGQDDEEVDFQIQWSATGANAWTGVPDLDVNAKTTSTLRKTVVITFPSRGQYDVRIQRTTDDHDGDTNRQMTSYWTALRSRTSLPPVNLGGVAYTCVHVRASDQLSGTINDFSGIVTSIAPDWDAGSSTWATRASRNPASMFRLLLQGQGAFDPVPDAEVDLPALQDWHEFCVAQNYTCDFVLDQEMTLWEAARLIAATGRASPTRASGKWSVVIDRPQTTPVTILTPVNTKGFKGGRVFVDYPDALRIQFVDSDNDYVTDERIVYADGFGDAAMVAANPSLALASKFQQWQLPGITTSDLAYRFGRYHLACAKLQPESYEYQCDWEWVVFQRGDLIHAMHDVPEWGVAAGYVTAVEYAGAPAAWSDAAGTAAGWTDASAAPAAWTSQAGGTLGNLVAFTIAETVQMAPGTSYVVRVRHAADGTQADFAVKTAPGGVTRLVADGTVPAAAAPAVGDLVVVGVAGSETVRLLVKGISPASDLEAKVTCIPYDDAIYHADTEAIPPWSANITPPPGAAVPLITQIRSDEQVLNRDADGSVHIGILVSLYNDGSRPLTSIVNCEVEYRKANSGAPFRTVLAAADAAEVLIPAADVDVEYEIAARYRLAGGDAGKWCPLQTHTVQGALIPPPDIATVYNSGDRVAWLFTAEPDFAGFRIRTANSVGQDWDSAIPLSDGLDTENFVLYAELPDGTAEILVKGETTAGVQSVNPGRLAVSLAGATKAVELFREDIAAEGFPSSVTTATSPVAYTNQNSATVAYTNATGQPVTYTSADTSAGGYVIVGGVLQAIDQSAWLAPPAGPWLGPETDPWLNGVFSDFTYTFNFTCPALSLPTDRILLQYVADGVVGVTVRWANGAVVRFADTDPIPAGGTILPPGWVPFGALPGPGSTNPFVPWRDGVRPIAGDTLEFRVTGKGGGAVRPAIRALAVVLDADLRTAVFGDLAVAAGGTQVLLPAGYRVASWVHATPQVPTTAASYGFTNKAAAGGPIIAGYDVNGQPVGFTGDVTVGYA